MFIWQFTTLLCISFNFLEAKSIKKSYVSFLDPFSDDESLGRTGKPPTDISNEVQRMQLPIDPIAPAAKDKWHGKWFPHVPGETQATNTTVEGSPVVATPKDKWQGKWFPQAPGEPHLGKMAHQQNVTTKDNWHGKWFPYAPGEPHVIKKKPLLWTKSEDDKSEKSGSQENWLDHLDSTSKDTKSHKSKQNICDDGKSNLAIDFDPNDIRDNLNYLCITSNRSLFQPNLTREAILTEHFLPSAYVPPVKCLNETISYTHLPATNGAYRQLPAEYGSYTYLPPQRYLRNLAEGAIVMLYHPCAFSGQVKQLQDIVSGCLYRHLISPSQALSPERPLALLAWSRSLEMSVVDRRLARDFIQKHAKLGPLAPEELSRVVDKRESYKAGLLTEAHLVTTSDDYEVCGYLQEEM
ncbi:uncharacterized protein LOC108107582 [Drosophila eugracilis]|uniref:uncharacterized protein LOC108107582 n=1 Tax=Drosophila eugracilis TaxID=29029 RepID=UPI0007E5CC53|nr:uncharacterized protein LOC108107582 [Drosophila eugracilis]